MFASSVASADNEPRAAAGRAAKADAARTRPPPAMTPGGAGLLRPSAVPSGSGIQRCGCAGAGACPSCEAKRLGVRLSARVPVSSPHDPAEAEAEAVADALVAPWSASPSALGPPGAPGAVGAPTTLAVSARPARAMRASAPGGAAGPAASTASTAAPARTSAASVGAVARPASAGRALPASPATPLRAAGLGDLDEGRPLPDGARGYFQPRLAIDLAGVRIHTGDAADAATAALGARAFAYGRDIVFGPGELAPQTARGRRLLAHELAHVAQQAHGVARLQRTTHGPTTPTNCANWTIPLPPWIAGTIAHGQISSELGIYPHSIPRASKIAMGAPTTPLTPFGFADMWSKSSAGLGIAEIKSTTTGPVVAAAEAAHYILRHGEWLTRAPWTALDDMAYATAVGASVAATPLDISGLTSSGLNLGMFWGDPYKSLWVEGDSTGAVVYWCTGVGVVGPPVWLAAFYALMKGLKAALDSAKRAIQDLLEGIGDAVSHAYDAVARWVQEAVDWVAARSSALAFILCILFLLLGIIGLIISIITAPASGGTSSVGGAASVAVLSTSAAALLVLIGASTPADAALASRSLTAAVTPSAMQSDGTAEEYERGASGAQVPTQATATALIPTDPMQPFASAAALLTSPVALAKTLANTRTSFSASEIAQIRTAADAVAAGGDSQTADLVKRVLA
jgi:Domain of unknown function (DUF4157)